MSSRWSRIERAFERALESSPKDRASVLLTTLPHDPDLRAEVERLLAAHDAAGDFLAPPSEMRIAALLAATPDESPDPEIIGRYHVLRRLGAGGMGIVYLAHDPQLDRAVALKLLRRPARAAGGGQQRVLEEARALSALDHPNVAAVHEVGRTDDGRGYIVMAYCEGEVLAERIRRGPVPARVAVTIARQVADALAAAHALGIVHRDVKPANIIVSADGRARLMDFGVAVAAERAGGAPAAGTPGYMSPEQERGEPAHPAADVWSLGVILREIFNARPDARQPPRAFDTIIARCLAEDPASRPAAARVAADLRLLEQRLHAPRRGRLGAVAIAVTLLVTVTALAVRTQRMPPTDAGLVAILPFTAAPGDSALERLGGELRDVSSTRLAGLAGLRVADLPALHSAEAASVSGGRGLREARRTGAAHVLEGRLTANGELTRVVARMRDARGRVVASAAAHAELDDVGALADSLVLALLRTDWGERVLPGTSHAAAATASFPALRAFLEGEQAVAGARFRLAPESYARAMEADSAFWLAYWRYWFARSYHGAPVDSAIRTAVIAQRASFPEPDRLLIEARMQTGAGTRLEQLRTITQRHPAYWPAWFELGDHLTHHGSFLGVPLEEASTALRRAAALHPGFVPAWEHLFWVAILERDTVESARVLERLTALRVDTLAAREWDLLPLDYYGYLDHLARRSGAPRAADTGIGVRVLANTVSGADPEQTSATLLLYGFAHAQLALSRGIVDSNPAPRIAAAHVWGSALAWAGRGAWDSAFAAAREYSRIAAHPRAQIRAYGLATAGAWLGLLSPDSAAALRAAAARSEWARSDDGAAEITWLDGLHACMRNDERRLEAAHTALLRSDAGGASALARTLHAFRTARDGREEEAGEMLARLAEESAEQSWQFAHGAEHPFSDPLGRIAAAHWLLAAGDTTRAAALLLLHETDLPNRLHPLAPVRMVLSAASQEMLADVEQARGRTQLARRHRTAVRERADLLPATPPRPRSCTDSQPNRR